MPTPSERFKSNLELASKLKLQANHWFSPGLADYVRHISSYEQMDPECLCIALINIAATTCRNSYITRGSHFKIPLNLYNIVVARSGYGKSTALDIAERGMNAAATFFSSEFAETIPGKATDHEKKKIPKMVYHDGSAAGILNKLKQCTRTLSFHEADVSLLKNLNVFMPSPFERASGGKVDPFRSTLMQLYDFPGQFTRQLKNEEINTTGSKLNIMGASTGDLFINQLIRQSSSSSADALFERIIYWPLDGVPIPDQACLLEIEFDRYPSIEQFSTICGFLGDLTIALDYDAQQLLSGWSYDMRLAGNQERNNDHLASRLAKSSHVLYRLSGFISILEAGFAITQDYLLTHHSFIDGVMTNDMFDALHDTVNKLYGSSTPSGTQYTIVVNRDVAQRAYDVTMGNIEQYKLLMHLTPDDIANWSIHKCARTKISSDRPNTSSDHTSPVISHTTLKFKQKTNKLKVKILLHDSLLFVKSSLYHDRQLKNASSILDKTLLCELVNEGYLIEVKSGIISKNNRITIFIKDIPMNEGSLPKFIDRLSKFDDEHLSYNSYMASCKKIVVKTAGIVSPKVFEILNRIQYQALNLDYSCLHELKDQASKYSNNSSLDRQCTPENCTDSDDDKADAPMQNSHSDASQPGAHQILDVVTDINVPDASQEHAPNLTTVQTVIQSMDANQNNFNMDQSSTQNIPVPSNPNKRQNKKQSQPQQDSHTMRSKKPRHINLNQIDSNQYYDPISTRLRSR